MTPGMEHQDLDLFCRLVKATAPTALVIASPLEHVTVRHTEADQGIIKIMCNLNGFYSEQLSPLVTKVWLDGKPESEES